MFLSRQRQHDARVVAAVGRQGVGAVLARDFHLRPLVPQVQTGRRLHHLHDVRAAHAGARFEEVEPAVRVAANELRVGHAAHQAQRVDHALVQVRQRACLLAVPVDGARDEDAALVGHLHRRLGVLVRRGEQHAASAVIASTW